jgi:hypothetical protein
MTGWAPAPGLKASQSFLIYRPGILKDKKMAHNGRGAGPAQLKGVKTCLLDITFRQYIFNL